MAEKLRIVAERGACPAAGAELADLASESVIACDLKGFIQYWNPASEALYGWPAMAMLGRRLGEISASIPLDSEHWQQLLREGRWHGPVRRCTATGSQITVSVRRTVRYNELGEALDVVEYGRGASIGVAEIGTHAAAEPQGGGAACWELDISGAHALLSPASAPEHPHDALGPDQEDALERLLSLARIVDVNDRTVRLFGGNADRKQMVGQPMANFWPAETRSVLTRLLAEVAACGPSQIIRRRLDQAQCVLRDATLTAWRSVAGGRNTAFLMVHGAAAGDRTAWELQASEDRYRKLIHYMPTALWQVDARGMGEILDRLRAEGVTDIASFLTEHPEIVELGKDVVCVTEVNSGAISLLGGRCAADLIRPVRYLFTGTPDTAKRIMIAHFEGRRNHAEQGRILTLNGRMRDVLFHVTYPMPPEQMDTTFITIEDITERLRTETQLRQLQADHAHAARISTLGELATSIAHEVKQPLAAIVTNAETSLRWLSRDDVNVEKLRQLTGRIISSASRANDIIQHVRSMAQRGERERTSLHMSEIVEEALLFVRHEIEARRIDLAITAAPSCPRILGDRIQLQQVIVNLIINSVQAIAQAESTERRIRICIGSGPPGALGFSIHDSGPGIAPDILDRVFESFFTTKVDGMGIGLSVCHSIITAHGGSIEAENHPRGGAIFRFSLPAQPHEARD
ncbi:PAS domain S-box protein [Roseomonas hellenica]|uniref:histidine kinase n=1 Tax=Plastoroseomonas hellenica TaxID=2687306 RepID=A0ABS5F2X9_9PROT|nr:ATP-binding protein [Plastoroseomonas hellenica]MBR0666480.1 PAS domain S-box protein [Plastoroseomonas hellenica]